MSPLGEENVQQPEEMNSDLASDNDNITFHQENYTDISQEKNGHEFCSPSSNRQASTSDAVSVASSTPMDKEELDGEPDVFIFEDLENEQQNAGVKSPTVSDSLSVEEEEREEFSGDTSASIAIPGGCTRCPDDSDTDTATPYDGGVIEDSFCVIKNTSPHSTFKRQ